MSSEEVIELSVEETNELRLKLGLKALRGVVDLTTTTTTTNTLKEEELSLSVEDSNQLRAKLGLAPLRGVSSNDVDGRKSSTAIHAPAVNIGVEDETRKRIETAKLKRDVERGLANLVASSSSSFSNDHHHGNDDDDDDTTNVMDWAAKMRSSNSNTSNTSNNNNNKKIKKKKKLLHRNRMSIPEEEEEYKQEEEYKEEDLKGMEVSHAMSDFEKGSSTILTLADHSIIGDNEEKGNVLENVNMVDDTKTKDNVKRKRQVEMGMGHAGGYAGYDDDEFMELGGSQPPSSFHTNTHNHSTNNNNNNDNNNKRVGFTIGSQDSTTQESDLFAHEKGNAIRLNTATTTTTTNHHGELVFQSQADFLTQDEDVEIIAFQQKQEKKRKKEEKKKFKKLKKEKKRMKKSLRHHNHENEQDEELTNTNHKKTLLEELEGSRPTDTDFDTTISQRKQRRLRHNHDSSSDDEEKATNEPSSNNSQSPKKDQDEMDMLRKQEKYNRAVEKGNKRTAFVFTNSTTDQNKLTSKDKGNVEEEEDDDDAFLSAALAKARRLQRLRELNNNANQNSKPNKHEKGAKDVVESMKIMNQQSSSSTTTTTTGTESNNGLTFEYDETREFTRALRARSEKNKASESNPVSKGGIQFSQPKHKDKQEINQHSPKEDPDETTTMHHEDGESLEELSKQIKDDNPPNNTNLESSFGGTGSTLPVGRGLANVLSMLKHTGEITGKNAGREEMRGRAKDKRTYEDYAPLKLNEVVTIDKNSNDVHAKDLEFANREISLEYRDEHGRLLTRKEAYRNLCYAFHGYGSSKKNQDRKLKQIERERGENSTVSKMLGDTSMSLGTNNNNSKNSNGQGTFGALKATQRATGKAFVVHKT